MWTSQSARVGREKGKPHKARKMACSNRTPTKVVFGLGGRQFVLIKLMKTPQLCEIEKKSRRKHIFASCAWYGGLYMAAWRIWESGFERRTGKQEKKRTGSMSRTASATSKKTQIRRRRKFLPRVLQYLGWGPRYPCRTASIQGFARVFSLGVTTKITNSDSCYYCKSGYFILQHLGLLDEPHDLLKGRGFSGAGNPCVHQALAAHLGNDKKKHTHTARSKT